METRILIIGAGAIGTAVGGVLKERKECSIAFWDRDAAKNPGQKPLADTVPDTHAVFLCIPSPAIRDAARIIAPFLKKETTVVSLAKGIEEMHAQTMDEVLAETLPSGQSLALLSGPMLAEELSKGMRGMGVYASATAAQGRMAELFSGTRLFIEYSNDLHGVALAGVLKNIYAFGLGISYGLEWGLNGKGWLAAKAATEMAGIIPLLGGKEETAFGTAGLGDLIATGYSPYSRNHQVGATLAQTGELRTSEGVVSLPPLIGKLPDRSRFPFLEALHNILTKQADVKETFNNLSRL